jgi:hypothetical protein
VLLESRRCRPTCRLSEALGLRLQCHRPVVEAVCSCRFLPALSPSSPRCLSVANPRRRLPSSSPRHRLVRAVPPRPSSLAAALHRWSPSPVATPSPCKSASRTGRPAETPPAARRHANAPPCQSAVGCWPPCLGAARSWAALQRQLAWLWACSGVAVGHAPCAYRPRPTLGKRGALNLVLTGHHLNQPTWL